MTDELMLEIKGVFDRWAKHIAVEVMARWGQIGNRPHIQGMAEVETHVINTVKDIITTEIIGIGQKALILEYGRGSQMDMLNPYLDKYVSWSGFNKHRGQNMRIVSREYGDYKDLDDVSHFGYSMTAGVNLEYIDDKYAPEEPHHVIRNIVCGDDGEQGVLNEIIAELSMVIVEYDFFKSFPRVIKL